MKDTIRPVKYLTLLLVAGVAGWVSYIVWVRLQPKPSTDPPRVHYFPADGAGELFTISALDKGAIVTSGALTCNPMADTKAKSFPVHSGETFRCGDVLLQVHAGSRESTLVLAGFDNVVPPVMIGSGHRFDREDGIRHLVLPGPGVGIDHLRLLPPADCGNAASNNALVCAENGGATGSMLVFQGAAPRALQHGERATLGDGTELWLGFVPLRLSKSKSGTRLDIAIEGHAGEGWLRTLGNRDWMGIELPAWPLERENADRTKGVVYTFLPEKQEFSARHLSAQRVEPEQEEQMQLLVDHELLCVDGVTRFSAKPALALRDLSTPGCNDIDGRRRSIEPLSTKTAAEVRDALHDSRLRELIASESRRIAGLPTGRGDQDSVLLFDYRHSMKTTANGQAVTVPVAIVGVRPRATLYRVLPPPPPATGATIRFSAGTSAPTLEALPRSRNLLLGLVTKQAMQVCEETTLVNAINFAAGDVAALPLGAVSFNGTGVAWLAKVPDTPAPGRCVTLRRNPRGTTVAAVAGTPAVVVRRSTRIPVKNAPVALQDDDDLVLASTSLHFRAAELPAAVTEHGLRRYPFEADAVQLLGLGVFSGGVEGSLERPVREALANAKTARDRELELTVDGDLQRVLSRSLHRAISRFTDKQYDDTRAAAVLLDAENGHVLAAATTPRFDPWRDPAHAALLASMKRGELLPRDIQKYLENYAFRRAAEIGSTQKIGTSIALARAGRLPDATQHAAGLSCNNKMSIAYADTGADATLKCDKNTQHDVIAHGAPLRESWRRAFAKSCNVYFSLCAADLVPRIGADSAAHRMNGATTVFRFSEQLKPGVDFRPLDLAQPGRGNGFFETAMLLGYRFEFRGAEGVPVQSAASYNGLSYPTAQRPWLQGLRVGRAFVYPTMPAPETFSNAYHGDVLWPAKNDAVVDDCQYTLIAREPMRGYLLLGFGQNLTGSPLSMATMATPILNSSRAAVTPAIIARPQFAAAPAAAPLFAQDAQAVLRDGLTAVVTEGTGQHYFEHAMIPAGVAIGGKTGTITIDSVEPASNGKDKYEVAFDYGCGVIGADVNAVGWNELAAEAGAAGTPQPPWGFASATVSCARRNPGLPRAVAEPAGNLSRVWKSIAKNAEGQREERSITSSAFIAAMWPVPALRPVLSHPLILAIVADHHDFAAKSAAAEVVTEILRFLSVRE